MSRFAVSGAHAINSDVISGLGMHRYSKGAGAWLPEQSEEDVPYTQSYFNDVVVGSLTLFLPKLGGHRAVYVFRGAARIDERDFRENEVVYLGGDTEFVADPADYHTHPGPGIRALLGNAFNVRQASDEGTARFPGDLFWETGVEEGISTPIGPPGSDTDFVRCLIFPLECEDRSDTAT